MLFEIAAFLTVVLRCHVSSCQPRAIWVWDVDANGSPRAQTAYRGYWENTNLDKMPTMGVAPAAPLEEIERPYFGMRTIGASIEQHAPDDTVELWRLLSGLSPAGRQQFLQVAKALQLALSIRSGNQTTSAALMVVACEALKPIDQSSTKKAQTVYFGDVIEGLLGADVAQRVVGFRPHPQGVRGSHLHHARLSGGELAPIMMFSTYTDPSFDQMARVLACSDSSAVEVGWSIHRSETQSKEG